MNRYRRAYRDAELVARAWFMLLPNLTGRLAMLAAIPIAAGTLHIGLQAGPSILNRAREGTNDIVGEYTAAYVVSLHDGDLGVFGMSVILAIAVAGFISPFTSGGNVSLISDVDLLGVRPSRLTGYITSIATTAFSIIGLFQLLALTLIASLLSIDADPRPAVTVAWLSWLPLIAITTLQTWVVELAARSLTPTHRRVLALGVVGSLAALLTFIPSARTIAGTLSDRYSTLLRDTAIGAADLLSTGLVLTATTVAAVLIGLLVSTAALRRPAPVAGRRESVTLRAIASPHGPVMLAQITALQVLRHREVLRPTLVITVANLAAVWFIDSNQQHVSAILTIAVAAGAGWAANMFGLLGPGATWMSTVPGLMRALPSSAFPVQFVIVTATCTVCWVLYALRHGTTVTEFVTLMCATVAVAASTARAAYGHSLRHPTHVRLGGTGDTVVRPVQAITYTLRVTPAAGVIAMGITSTDSLATAISVTVAVLCWVAARWALTDRKWDDQQTRSTVVSKVATA